MHVALFLPNLGGGGAERMMVNLANGLKEEGKQVDVVLASAEGPYLKEISKDMVVDLKAGSVIASLPKLVNYLRSVRPDVLISTLSHANLAAVWARQLAGSPTRVYLREANMLSVGKPGLKNNLILKLVKRVYRGADGIVAVSEGVAEDVHEVTGIPRSKIHTVFNPVVTDSLVQASRQPADHPWYQEREEPIILAAGSLTAQKDFQTLIKAFSLLQGRCPSRLVILGEGKQRDELTGLTEDLGVADAVDMPGFVDNPFSYMANASVFVLSSAWEGMPGVLIQALACGCPVVSTDCPSGPSEVLQNGRYGKLVAVGAAEEMADAILETISSPHDLEALKARAQIFSVEASTKRYLEVIGASSPLGTVSTS